MIGFREAFNVLMDIENDGISTEKKLEAIRFVGNAETLNSIPKEALKRACKWIADRTTIIKEVDDGEVEDHV